MVRLIFILCVPLLSAAQTFTFTAPEELPKNIVNTVGEELMPILSPDGKTLYFSRGLWDYNIGGLYGGQDIWSSEKLESTGWRKATNVLNGFNTRGNEAVVGINRQGNTIYFMKTTPGKKVKGLYFSRRVKGQWAEPQLIEIEGIETLSTIGFFMHPDEDVLIISANSKEGMGEEDLFVSEKTASGKWTAPKSLGSTINTSGFEISPFLSHDKKQLYFASNSFDGFGDADIFVSTRMYDSWDVWSTPKNLGAGINSPKFDAYFFQTEDSACYFSSNRAAGDCDIYVTYKVKKDQQVAASTDKIITEANALLQEIKEVEGGRVIIVFADDSYSIPETSRNDLNNFIQANRGRNVEILAFFKETKDIEPNGIVFQRIESAKKFLTGSGFKGEISIRSKESEAKLQSSRYVFVSLK